MITFEEISKTFPDGTEAVKNLSMKIKEDETLVLLGTSGSGKTTTMKMVNRLIEPSSGHILINGKDVMEQDAVELRRGIGYAIQHIGLFPHMTIAENIAVVPKLLDWSKGRIDERIDELLTMVGLEPVEFRDRFPNQLSGGQQQRIGVARALAADPPIVLMDEPFGALDPITREQLQNEFIELESEIKKTIIFVTHDVFEAVKMGDRIALLDGGELQQLAPPLELVEKPANDFVEQFLGQHRFQLSLLTMTVEKAGFKLEEVRADPEDNPQFYLFAKNSLIEALDVFNKSGQIRLPVFKGKNCFGILSKSQLVNEISNVLSSKEREA